MEFISIILIYFVSIIIIMTRIALLVEVYIYIDATTTLPTMFVIHFVE